MPLNINAAPPRVASVDTEALPSRSSRSRSHSVELVESEMEYLPDDDVAMADVGDEGGLAAEATLQPQVRVALGHRKTV